MSFPPLPGHLPFYAVVVVVFLLMISVLVFAHEAGHYLFARLFNMGVEEFAIGFGRKPIVIYGRRKYAIPLKPDDLPSLVGRNMPVLSGEPGTLAHEPGALGRVAQALGTMEGGDKPTEAEPYPRHPINLVETPNGPELHEETVFTVRPLPLGGFVRIKGMLPEEDGSETRIPGGFYSKPPWQRLIVLLAGPAFSVLAGVLILVPVYMVDGITKPDNKPVLGEVFKDRPASKAKLKEGDLILAVQGTPIATFYDVLTVVTHNPGVPLTFEYRRGGKDYSTVVTPDIDKEPTKVLGPDLEPTADNARQGRIGTRIRSTTIYPSLGAALYQASRAPIDTVLGIFQILQRPARFQDNVSGPGQMVEFTAMAVQDGVLRVFELMAVLSISVGIFNLLPFPPLDGGQMVIAFAEMLRGGRRLSMQIQGLVSAVGLLAVCSLILSAMYFDFQTITRPQPKSGVPLTVPATPAKPGGRG